MAIYAVWLYAVKPTLYGHSHILYRYNYKTDVHYASKPTLEHHASKPTLEHRASKPTLEHYASKPSFEHHAGKPTLEHHASKSTLTMLVNRRTPCWGRVDDSSFLFDYLS